MKMNSQTKEMNLYIDALKTKVKMQEFAVNSAKRAQNAPAAAENPLLIIRVSKLEQQVTDLLDQLEAVTIENEELQINYDSMEDNYFKCMVELESYKKQLAPEGEEGAAPSAGFKLKPEDEVKMLKVENDKLREGLRRLNELSLQDKEQLKHLHPKLEERDKEVTELRDFKKTMQQTTTFLQETVDSTAGFEDIIGKLTEQNLSISQSMETYRATVTDLEVAMEITDELDSKQKAELEENAQTITALQTAG